MVRVRRLAGKGMWVLLLVGLLGGLDDQVPQSAVADPPPEKPSVSEKAPAPHPLDQPLAWLAEARKFHQPIRDYTCTLVKQERLRGNLQEENIISMRFRNQPFSVYMRWLLPARLSGQEVAFVQGKNRNKMRVHSKGIKGIVNVVDPLDRRVLEQSRHTIYEAGLGNLIEQTYKIWEMERRLNKTQVKIEEYMFDKRPCIRVETIRSEPLPNLDSFRSVLYLDKKTKLPIRTENYDWPREGESPEGDLLEMFSYVNLQFNVNLGEESFLVRGR